MTSRLSPALLDSFVEIYRTRSVTEAARRLGLTQPALSAQLARLEAHLGEPLFHRSRRGVEPTPRAVLLAERVAAPVDALRAATGSQASSGAPLGRVRIGGASDVMALRVLPALTPLVADGLEVHATLGLADDLLGRLAAAELDLVVSSVRPTTRGVRSVPFVDEEFVLVASPAVARSVDRGRLAADPAEALAHLPFVAYADDLPIIRRYWQTEFGHRPRRRVSVVVPDLRGVLAAVVAGTGMSVLPRYVAGPALDAGTVELVHTPETGPLNTLHLVTRGGGGADATVTRVVEHLLVRAREWGSL